MEGRDTRAVGLKVDANRLNGLSGGKGLCSVDVYGFMFWDRFGRNGTPYPMTELGVSGGVLNFELPPTDNCPNSNRFPTCETMS